LLKLNLF